MVCDEASDDRGEVRVPIQVDVPAPSHRNLLLGYGEEPFNLSPLRNGSSPGLEFFAQLHGNRRPFLVWNFQKGRDLGEAINLTPGGDRGSWSRVDEWQKPSRLRRDYSGNHLLLDDWNPDTEFECLRASQSAISLVGGCERAKGRVD